MLNFTARCGSYALMYFMASLTFNLLCKATGEFYMKILLTFLNLELKSLSLSVLNFSIFDVQEYEECGVIEEASKNSEVKLTITDIIFPYNHTMTTCLDKRKEAASTLNQMLLVLETMDHDLDHRVGNLRRCLSMKI